jgi:hypothetical protein
MAIVTVGLVAVAAVLAVVVGLAGGLALGKTKAQGAADASALAAASDARDRRAQGFVYGGQNAPSCSIAREVARRWGATVTMCAVGPGRVATVTVGLSVSLGELRATARAGPRASR